jgi:hypothetical protein
VASVLVPEDTPGLVKVVLAVGSAAGVPFVLGVVILVAMLIAAPGRRERDEMRHQIEALQSKAVEGSKTTIYAPNSNFFLGEEASVKESLKRGLDEEG